MRARELHPWDLDPDQAAELQRQLAGQVRTTGRPESVRLVAGVDVSYSKDSPRGYGVVAVLSYPALEVVETATATVDTTFPYVPGLFSFREIPAVLAALEKIRSRPDLVLVDGQGRAHPRRMGLASHLGLLLEIPTIGCAKTRLCGDHDEPAHARGSRSPLTEDGETIGLVVRTQDGVNPLFVSVGDGVDLDTCADWVVACARDYRIPEPLRSADHLTKELRRSAES